MTSADGVSWTPRLLPSWAIGLTWVLLQHNGPYFLAISNGGVCATSADGINWISHTLPIVTANANNYPNSYMAWKGTIGLWLLINSGGTTYYTSPDGRRALSHRLVALCGECRQHLFLQDSGTNNSIYSRNGITWTQATQRTSPPFPGYYINGYNYGTAGVAWIAGAPAGGSPYYYASDVTGNLWTSSTQVPAFPVLAGDVSRHKLPLLRDHGGGCSVIRCWCTRAERSPPIYRHGVADPVRSWQPAMQQARGERQLRSYRKRLLHRSFERRRQDVSTSDTDVECLQQQSKLAESRRRPHRHAGCIGRTNSVLCLQHQQWPSMVPRNSQHQFHRLQSAHLQQQPWYLSGGPE